MNFKKPHKYRSHQKGSALLIVLMMVILLTVLILEISFSAQTAYSLAKNQIENAQVNAVAESGFAYALNIVQIKSGTNNTPAATTTTTTDTTVTTTTDTNPLDSSAESLFNNVADMNLANNNATAEGPLWKSDFPVVAVGNIKLKLKISLEETKININRVVNSEDKVDVRIRSALIEIFKKFEGTEEDVDRVIDYIDANQLGQYEDGALNVPLQGFADFFRIPNLSVKYSLQTEETNDQVLLNPQQEEEEKTNQTLADYITMRSTGRVNINYAEEDTLKGIINGAQEQQILDTILQQRSDEPYKTTGQLSLHKTFGTAFKKMANYVTVDESTFKVTVIVKSATAFKPRVFIGYISKSPKSAHYFYRTERIYNSDPETLYDSNSIPDDDTSFGTDNDMLPPEDTNTNQTPTKEPTNAE